MSDNRSYTHNLSSCEIKPEKRNSSLSRIQTHDFCDTGAVLYPPPPGGVLPQILDGGVPRRFLKPNPI